MNIIQMKEFYRYILPFTVAELKDNILMSAFRDSVNFYNQYVPRTSVQTVDVMAMVTTFPNQASSFEFINRSPTSILRLYVYMVGPFDTSPNNLIYNWTYQRPVLWAYPGIYYAVCCYDWQMKDFYLENPETGDIMGTRVAGQVPLNSHNFLIEMIKCNIIIAASNRRRMGVLNELPIDFKGDQFYGEAVAELQTLKEQVQRLTPITY